MAEPPDDDGAPPALPDGDDPFVLLGVEPGADARTIKRAYVRRIKQFRPDRAPEAFARIQQAFEQLQGGAAAAGEPVAEPKPSGGDDRPVEGGTLESRLLAAPPDEQRRILTETPITWRELSMWRHPGEAFAVWATAFAARLEDPERLDAAVEMAGEPALLEDASHEPTAAILFLKAVSAIAWRDAEQARLLYRQLRSPIEHPVVGSLVDRATLDVDVAGSEYAAYGRPPLPPEMMALLSESPFATHAAYHALLDALRDALRSRPRAFLGEVSAALVERAALGVALGHRLFDGVPAHRRELSALTYPLYERVNRELGDASRWTWWLLSPLLALAVGFGGYLVAEWLRAASPEGMNDVPKFVYPATLALAVATWFGSEALLYRRVMRGRLAGALVGAGVTVDVAGQWMGRSWSRFRLARFRPWIERDHALRVVGFLAATVAEDDVVEN